MGNPKAKPGFEITNAQLLERFLQGEVVEINYELFATSKNNFEQIQFLVISVTGSFSIMCRCACEGVCRFNAFAVKILITSLKSITY
jgi:hypothetical protein